MGGNDDAGIGDSSGTDAGGTGGDSSAGTDGGDAGSGDSGDTGNDDQDGDGIPNDVEIANGTDPNDSSDPSTVNIQPDGDGDGIPDDLEVRDGSDPDDVNSPVNNGGDNEDDDGLSDGQEIAICDAYPSLASCNNLEENTLNATTDSDGDGETDWQEYVNGTDPGDGLEFSQPETFFPSPIVPPGTTEPTTPVEAGLNERYALTNFDDISTSSFFGYSSADAWYDAYNVLGKAVYCDAFELHTPRFNELCDEPLNGHPHHCDDLDMSIVDPDCLDDFKAQRLAFDAWLLQNAETLHASPTTTTTLPAWTWILTTLLLTYFIFFALRKTPL